MGLTILTHTPWFIRCMRMQAASIVESSNETIPIEKKPQICRLLPKLKQICVFCWPKTPRHFRRTHRLRQVRSFSAFAAQPQGDPSPSRALYSLNLGSQSFNPRLYRISWVKCWSILPTSIVWGFPKEASQSLSTRAAVDGRNPPL